MERDNTYEKIIVEYQANLDKVNKRISQLRKCPQEGKKLSTYYQMRADLRQAIKSMSKYTHREQEK